MGNINISGIKNIIITNLSNKILSSPQSTNIYIITFNSNSGTSPIPSTKQVITGTPYGVLATTSRSGFNFSGWFTSSSGGGRIEEDTIFNLTSNQTLFAQ
jgi:hypothetical protein